MGEGLGWGCPLNFGGDAVGHGVCIPERILIANAQNAIALRAEPGVSFGIVKLGFGQIVSAAVDFDHQLRAMMDEIDDIPPYWSLASDVEVELAKRLPEDTFASGHFPP
jgi:hypothetical protein